MRYELVWGFLETRGLDETKIKGSNDFTLLEDAQRLLGDMGDDDLMKYLDIDDIVLNSGIYFKINEL